jgi:hypothetical protein
MFNNNNLQFKIKNKFVMLLKYLNLFFFSRNI